VPVGADTLQALMAAGVTGEKLIEIVRLIDRDMAGGDDNAAEKRRAYDRERKRVLRNSGGKSGGQDEPVSGGKSGGIPPETTPLTRGENNLSRLDITGRVGVVGAREGSDDWPEGDSRAHVKLLVEHAASQWLDPDKSHGLVTTSGRVSAWRAAGASWPRDVLPVVAGLCAGRRDRIGSWKFFDDAIARSIADNQAALEIPEAGTFRAKSTGPPLSYSQQADAVFAVARAKLLEAEE
jgi:hypothetical protein